MNRDKAIELAKNFITIPGMESPEGYWTPTVYNLACALLEEVAAREKADAKLEISKSALTKIGHPKDLQAGFEEYWAGFGRVPLAKWYAYDINRARTALKEMEIVDETHL